MVDQGCFHRVIGSYTAEILESRNGTYGDNSARFRFFDMRQGAIDCVEGLCVMVCDTGCSTNDDCAPDEYCDASSACALDGSCTELADCSADGNEYDVPNCVGALVCTAGLCSMDCNFLPAPCAAVAGIDFGACEMVLGWAPSFGGCTFFSGCGEI